VTLADIALITTIATLLAIVLFQVSWSRKRRDRDD
jgi:hypothetical protein